MAEIRLISRRNWLGRLDSNQRMAVPKTAALPLGYAPTWHLPGIAAGARVGDCIASSLEARKAAGCASRLVCSHR